jgi:hypothetical protein
MTGLKLKYFVLKPEGDNLYSAASRKALRAYAHHIRGENEQLADDLIKWAQEETEKTDTWKKNVEDLSKWD